MHSSSRNDNETNFGTMLLFTRLSGVTFKDRQAKLAALKTDDTGLVSIKLRHNNNYKGFDGIAAFKGKDDLGWIPKEIASGLLLPEITAGNIQIERFELIEIVGGTPDKPNYGAEVMLLIAGDVPTLDVLAESINELRRKATLASVSSERLRDLVLIRESEAKQVKHTKVDDNHKLGIFGSTQLKTNDMRKILFEYDISDEQCRIDSDYYGLKNDSTISRQFKYLFFGPTPHSGKDMGEDMSIIAHFENDPNYDVTTIRSETGQLKITAHGLRQALDGLVVA